MARASFELTSVYHNATSGGIIRMSFDFLEYEDMFCVLITIASLKRF